MVSGTHLALGLIRTFFLIFMTSCQPNLKNLIPLCSQFGFHISFLHSLGPGLWCTGFESHPRQLEVYGHEAAGGDVVQYGG